MKRYRAVDVPPKFRRTAKGRNTRIGESVFFSRFFSASNLVYLKFFLMWLGCIALDFLIGFRFELLWPVWLLIRHLYESCRVHAFSSSLHYSAFSVFFVCVTATSDLVCYLFIPIQVLIFLASTYVWVQFVYQSSDRGVCLPSLFLWALFIVFEYSVRYRFDNATWYLTRTSWITAGLFPSTADSVSIGLSGGSSTAAGSSPSSTRLELYRPFAAHCIGFPVVTLGFRVKSLFSNWRMRVRREEVMRQNEFFERLLADAIPTSFENRKHFISSRSHLSIEQDAIDYDSAYGTSELLMNGFDVNGQPRLYSTAPNSFAAICAPSIAVAASNSASSIATASSAMNLTTAKTNKQPKMSKQHTLSASFKQQNGGMASKRNGIRADAANGGSSIFVKKTPLGEKRISSNGLTATSVPGTPTTTCRDESILFKLWRVTVRFFCLFVLSTFGQLLSTLTPSIQQTLESILAQLRGSSSSSQNQDDLISTSGEGSNVADEEEWEHDSNPCHGNFTDHHVSKKKSRRARGFSSVSQTSTANSNNEQQQLGYAGAGSTTTLCRTTASSSNSSSLFASTTTAAMLHQKMVADMNGDINSLSSSPTQQQHQHDADSTTAAECSLSLLRENALRMSELRQLHKEKQTLELSIDKLKLELKAARSGEHDLRLQLTQSQQQEQCFREEFAKFEREQKQKSDQLEAKCKQLGKQNEHFKTNIQALERRVGELQLRKMEMERELTNERLKSSQQSSRDDLMGKQQTNDGGEFKLKLTSLDRELKLLKKDTKAKNEQCAKLDEEVRQLRSANNDEGKQNETLRQKNFVLEQTLSSENKLKQDLFRALNDSKAEIATLKARLHAKQTKEQNDMMNAFRDNGGANSLFHNSNNHCGGSSGSSPTAHHHQQPPHFPLSQQQRSLTPPPLSVASSTYNLEQLLQATQNMSYSLGPLDSNGTTNTGNANNNGNVNNSSSTSNSTASPYGAGGSEMLAIGGHRTLNNNHNTHNNSGGGACRGGSN